MSSFVTVTTLLLTLVPASTALAATWSQTPSAAGAPFDGTTAVVTYRPSKLTLPRTVSASGARYASGDVMVWSRGFEVTFQRGNQLFVCTGS